MCKCKLETETGLLVQMRARVLFLLFSSTCCCTPLPPYLPSFAVVVVFVMHLSMQKAAAAAFRVAWQRRTFVRGCGGGRRKWAAND